MYKSVFSGALLLLGICHSGDAQGVNKCPSPATNAFTGCYYDNITLTGDPVFIRTDNTIDFYWGNGTPDKSLSPLNFSARWQGNFVFTQGNYTFTALTSDGMRLYLDGNPIIDHWRNQPPYLYTASQTVSQGIHLVTVEYYEVLGGATAQISWKNDSPVSQAPTVSAFTASPASSVPGAPVVLSWGVSGATSVSIDNGVGDVTNLTRTTVFPVQTATYTLTARNDAGTNTATVKVTVGSAPDNQPPSVPTLTSATQTNATQVDLAWTPATDNTGVTGYQVIRNGVVIASVSGSTLNFADTGVAAGASYIYTLKALDAAGNISVAGNSVQIATAAPAPPTSGACPGPSTNAFTGCYYSNITLSGDPTLVRTDSQINFYWGNGTPDPSLAPLNFSARWQGNFTFSQGDYLFSAITSDGMRLYIDGNLIINRWRDQSPYLYTATQRMSQGSHLVTVEYYEHLGGATAQVSWATTSPVTQVPAISSFTASQSTVAPAAPVTLAWNVSGATSVTIDNGVGTVTGQNAATVSPVQTTTYTLTATSDAGSSTAVVTVRVAQSTDTQAPTAPTLVSAVAKGSTEVDLTWTAGTDNVGVVTYQILRNGAALSSVPGSVLTFADMTASAGTSYVYSISAVDAAGNHSGASNSVQAATAAASPISVTWYGACWQTATLYGNTGNFQAIDFALSTPKPVALQGTLFFGPTCNASFGTDNMNDFNSLTGSTHMVQGFSHHPDEMPTSAIYWFGERTADGMCAPGSPCSGCVTYTKATPSCDVLP